MWLFRSERKKRKWFQKVKFRVHNLKDQRDNCAVKGICSAGKWPMWDHPWWAVTPAPGSLFWPLWALAHMWYTLNTETYTHIFKNLNYFLNLRFQIISRTLLAIGQMANKSLWALFSLFSHLDPSLMQKRRLRCTFVACVRGPKRLSTTCLSWHH